ncbi:MAG TPA: histidine phosphatase family protein [Burkholderiales bacterium]|nr:histidine phosphatase family protein [Burkholderiales bacterium]
MQVIFWRHAEAEAGAIDDVRKLTRKGRKQAKRVAAWLEKKAPARARILVSPARRAQQTAKALTSRFQTTAKVGATASAQELLAAAGWPRGRGTVILVGHQPELGRAAALAVTGRRADWDIKKGALWWIERRKAGQGIIVRAVISPDFL